MGNTQTIPATIEIHADHKEIIPKSNLATTIADFLGSHGEIKSNHWIRSNKKVNMKESDKIRVTFTFPGNPDAAPSQVLESIGHGSIAIKTGKCDEYTSVNLLLKSMTVDANRLTTLVYVGRVDKCFDIHKEKTKLNTAVSFIYKPVNPPVNP
jgi:hypothetical protein